MTTESPVAVTLERLTEAAAKPADNVEVLRSLVARLHGKIKAQGESRTYRLGYTYHRHHPHC